MIESLFGVWLALMLTAFGWLWCLRLLWVAAEYEHAIQELVMRLWNGNVARCRDHHLTGRSVWWCPR